MLTYRCLLEPIKPTPPPPVLSDQQDSNTLCDHCQNIAKTFREISEWLKRGERIRRVEYARLDHYPHFPKLATSAEDGCACCALLRYTITRNWSLRQFTEDGVGDLDDGTRLYSDFLDTGWDGEVRIDDLRFVTSSTIAGQVEFLAMRVGPSAYTKIKGYRVIEEDDGIDTLSQIAVEFVLKVFKPACPSVLFFAPFGEKQQSTDLIA
jgi:hypothetical protein